MIDPYLSIQVAEAAEAAARRVQSVNVEGLWQRFVQAATSQTFAARLPVARSHRWAGAIPTWEHPGSIIAPPAVGNLPVIGIDGSQIYPLDRSPVVWAYVQAVACRQGCPPVLKSRFVDIGSRLVEQGSDLDENRDELTGLTNAWRALLEMELAREMAVNHPGSLTLLDNGLLPWLSVSGQLALRHLQEYLADYCGIQPGMIAGVISGPQSHLLERLVHLVEADTLEEGLQDRREFLDLALMLHVLKPGERSALFKHGSPRNDRFEEQGGGVYFFFLRTQRAEIARVEIPEWVARDAEKVGQVHVSILLDAMISGYSYVLSQAHQQAAISLDVANTLRERAAIRYMQASGRSEAIPAKSAMKRG